MLYFFYFFSRRERGYCSICWSSDMFELSLQTADNGVTGNSAMSEHDLDCGRLEISDKQILDCKHLHIRRLLETFTETSDLCGEHSQLRY